MVIVTIHEAKTHLSKLIQRVLTGEEIIVAKGKKPVAKIVPIPAFKKSEPWEAAKES